MSTTPRPTVGRIVHWVAPEGGHWAALTVCPPGVTPYPLPHAVSEGTGPNTWHWPERA